MPLLATASINSSVRVTEILVPVKKSFLKTCHSPPKVNFCFADSTVELANKVSLFKIV